MTKRGSRTSLMWGFVMMAGAVSGCADERSEEQRKIDTVLSAFGYDPRTAVITDDRIVVEEDIVFWRKDIDGYLEVLRVHDKAYVCDPNNPGFTGVDGRRCGLSFDQFVMGQAIIGINSVRLNIESNVPANLKLAFRRGAAGWTTAIVDDKGTNVGIDAEGKRASSQWTITLRVDDTMDPPAIHSSFPAPQGGFLRPGTLITVHSQRFGSAFDQVQLDGIALHELGHALGFAHRGQGILIPGTDGGVGCDATMMCQGDHFGQKFLSDDDVRGAQYLYPPISIFNLNAWSSTFCSPAAQCTSGEGHCENSNECAGFLVCLGTTTSRTRYGAPDGGRVCGPPSTERNEGTVSCPANGAWARCESKDCPCGLGDGDCDGDQQCGGGLSCGVDNGMAAGLSITKAVCTHARIPGCPKMDKYHLNDELCTHQCPCSLGEGDCDDDDDCIGDLVCARHVGAAFITRPDYDFCVRPEQKATLEAMPSDPDCDNGVLHSNGACCHELCGTCGSSGCSSQTSGGAEACCTGRILARNLPCSQYPAPCVVD